MTPVHAAQAPIAISSSPASTPPSRQKNIRSLIWLGVSLSANAGLAAAAPLLTPNQCRWCDTAQVNAFDANIRDAIRWDSPKRAHQWSNVVGFAFVPALSLGLSSWMSHRASTSQALLLSDTLRVGHAVSLTLLSNQIVKYAVGRRRPFARADALGIVGQASPYRHSSDENLSFFSGHTAISFALASSSSMLATRRLGAPSAWVWTGSLVAASAVGWLRLAADKHYGSDVIVGALVGTVIGVATTVPTFFVRRSASPQVSFFTSQFGLRLSGQF